MSVLLLRHALYHRMFADVRNSDVVMRALQADILNFDSINAHAVNLPIMLVQLFTGRMEMVPAHAVFVVGFALTYVMM